MLLKAALVLASWLIGLWGSAGAADGNPEVPLPGEIPPYQVEGSLVMENYFWDGRIVCMRYQFLIAVSNQVWKIVSVDGGLTRIVPTVTSSPGTYRHLKVQTDGTNLYALYYYSSNSSLEFRPEPGDKDLRGTARTGIVPGDDGLKVIWMAFASGYALDHISGWVLPHPWELGYNPPRTNYQVVVERAAQPPRLPQRAVYWFPGFFYDEQGKRVSDPKPYDAGWVFAEYHVLRMTNCGPLTLPLVFTFQRFGPKVGALRKEDTELVGQFRCDVRTVLTGAPALTEPPVSGSIKVWDYRLGEDALGRSAIVVEITNENWLPSNHPALLARLAEAQAQAAKMRRGFRFATAKWRGVAFLAVAGASAAFPAFLLLRWRRKQNNQQQ